MRLNLENIIIAYDCAYINGGAAKVAIQSAIALSKLNYHVYFFAVTGPVDSDLQSSKVEVQCLGLNDINHGNRLSAAINGIWNKKVEKSFQTFLERFSPNNTIVHLHGWAKALSSAIVSVSERMGFNTLITLHDYFTLCPNGGLYDYKKQEICTKDPMSLACKLCNCDKRSYAQKLWRVARQLVQDRQIRNNPNIAFISISKKNEDAVRSYVRSKHFYRVDNPVEMADHQIQDCTKSNIYLYVGRLSEEKGIELFCEAITELKSRYKIEGVVVGNGILMEKLKSNYDGIRFVGWKDAKEVGQYMQEARMLVLPSKWYEGAPLTIIEAMSAGLPCIVSDCTSATEIIKDGVNGFVFETGNTASLKEKISQAEDDDRLRNIQQTMKESFSANQYYVTAHINKLLETYQECMNQ